MPHGSGGSYGGGDSGGGFSGGGGFSSSPFEHGRTSGGSFDTRPSHGSSDHHHNDHWGPGYYSSGPGYYSSSPMFVNTVQRPPIDRKKQALAQNKSCFLFVLIASFMGTFWLLLGPYGSTTIGLDVNTSRLVTARPYFARTMKFTNEGEFQGPVLYSFHLKPELDSEVRWSDYQNYTVNYEHREFFYYLNKGSTVRMKANVKIPERNVLYFKVIRGTEDLEAFLERPDEASIRLRGYIEYKFEASADDDYIFAFANVHRVDAELTLELDFHSRKYDVRHAKERCHLRTHCELDLPLFGSSYGVLETPGVGETPVDNWKIVVSYGTRWGPIILIYCLIVLIFLVQRARILKTSYEIEDTYSESAPLVTSIEEGVPAPSAPIIPASIPEEEEYAYRRDKEVAEDHLCSVCLDASKDSFFLQCGHRATCFACGLRISKSEQATCPICRQPITEVKKIFDA